MTRYYLSDFRAEPKHPKFYDGTIRMMENLNRAVLSDHNDVEILLFLLREQLKEDAPAGHPSRVYIHENSDRSGQLYIMDGRSDKSVTRICFHPIEKATTYDLEEKAFLPMDIVIKKAQKRAGKGTTY